MAPSADDKKYATDTRQWSVGVLADGIYPTWQDSPVSLLLQMKDICIYGPNDVNKLKKIGKTSWDSFSYALLMSHNVWMHLQAVQEANQRFDQGQWPAMLRRNQGNYEHFAHIVDRIFSEPSRQQALNIVDSYSEYWMEIVGTRGFKGKKAMNARTQFNAVFVFED